MVMSPAGLEPEKDYVSVALSWSSRQIGLPIIRIQQLPTDNLQGKYKKKL
jgi:hypothetical protein